MKDDYPISLPYDRCLRIIYNVIASSNDALSSSIVIGIPELLEYDRHFWVIHIQNTSFVAILCAHENHISLALLQFLPNDSFYVLLFIVIFVVLFLSIFSVPTERYTCMCIYSSSARQCDHSFTEHNNFETQESLVVMLLLST